MKAKHVVKENAASPGTQDWKNKLLPGSNNNNDFKTQIKTIAAHFPCMYPRPAMYVGQLIKVSQQTCGEKYNYQPHFTDGKAQPVVKPKM